MYLHEPLVNGFVCARLRGPLDEARLRRALDELPRRHPLLGVRVIREQGVLTFTTEGVPRLPLKVIADDGSGRTFLNVAAEELVTPVDRTTGPLCRFTLVRHPDGQRADLLVTGDHTVADATAIHHVIRDLLTAEESPELEPDPVPLPPPVSHLFPASVLEARPPHVSPPAGRPLPTGPSLLPSEVMLAPAELMGEPLRLLEERCKARGVTVHAAICAAFAESRAALSDHKTQVRISSPISYRHRFDPPARGTVSSSVTFATTHLDFSTPDAFWEQAHAVGQQLSEWKTDEKLFGALAVLEAANQAEPDDARFLQWLHQHRAGPYDFSLSNLRRLPIPGRYGDLTIEAVHGGSCLPGERVIFLITVGETMYLTLTTCRLSQAENDLARRVVASALSRLGNLPA